jgi:hypothetical protein
MPATFPPGGYVQVRTTNGFAIASLVLGFVWLFGLGSLLALIFGLVARKQIDDSNGQQSGKGMAIAGIVLGIVGLVGILFVYKIAPTPHNSCDPNVQVC